MSEITRRKCGLDILRIIATILIVLHHYQQVIGDFPGSSVSFYSGKIYFGYTVEFFFVLSGFLTFPYIKKIDNGMNFGLFYGKKAKRFLPWVFASSVGFYLIHIVYVFIHQEAWLSVYPHWWEILINSMGMQDGWFFDANRLNFPLWYISILFLCYGWFYLFTWIGTRTKIPRVFFYALMFFAGIAIKTCLARGILIHVPFINGYSARGYAAFFFGLLVACYYRKWRRRDFYTVIVVTFSVLLAFFFINIGILEYLLMIIAFGAVTAFFSADFINTGINGIAIKNIGESTFYVYIWHMPALLLLVLIKDLVIHNLRLDSFLTMGIFTILLFLAGWGMHSFCFKRKRKTFGNS